MLAVFQGDGGFSSAQVLHAPTGQQGIRIGLTAVYRALSAADAEGWREVVYAGSGPKAYRHLSPAHERRLTCRSRGTVVVSSPGCRGTGAHGTGLVTGPRVCGALPPRQVLAVSARRATRVEKGWQLPSLPRLCRVTFRSVTGLPSLHPVRREPALPGAAQRCRRRHSGVGRCPGRRGPPVHGCGPDRTMPWLRPPSGPEFSGGRPPCPGARAHTRRRCRTCPTRGRDRPRAVPLPRTSGTRTGLHGGAPCAGPCR